jgi:hypothetical protein
MVMVLGKKKNLMHVEEISPKVDNDSLSHNDSLARRNCACRAMSVCDYLRHAAVYAQMHRFYLGRAGGAGFGR